MDENVVIKGKIKKNMLAIAILVIGIIAGLLSFVFAYDTYQNGEDYMYYGFGIKSLEPYWAMYNKNFSDFYTAEFFNQAYGYMLIFNILAIIIYVVLKLFTERCEITVNKSSVYGTLARGKKIEIPLNQITAMHKCPFSGISLTALSGVYKFYLIENRESVIKELSHLLASPNSEHAEHQESTETQVIEQLIKLKELVDAGVLTQEEFDEKKRKLLTNT